MTYKHECRNCRWCYKTTYERYRCANVRSGRNNVQINDWCGKWEHEPTQKEGEKE